MLDWLKKLRGSRPFENKVKLDDRSIELLAEDFAILDDLSAEIASRVLRYLLEGRGEEVLAELAVLTNGAEKFKLICTQQFHFGENTPKRRELFKSLKCSDPEFFIRLGRVYEAISRSARLSLFRSFGDPNLDWLEILLIEASELSLNVWPRRCRACPCLSADLVEALLRSEGHPPELLVRTAFQPEIPRFGGVTLEPIFEKMSGLAQSAVRHKGTLLATLNDPDYKKKIYALKMMKQCRVPATEFLDKIVELAVCSSKQVREHAEVLLADAKAAARPLLERKAGGGENDERAAAARLLWQWEGEKARPFLEARAAEERNKKVAGIIQDLLAVHGAGETAASNPAASAFDLPPLPPIPDRLPLGPDTERAWRECFEKVNAAIAHIVATKAQHYFLANVKPIPESAVRDGFTMLQGGVKVKAVLEGLPHIGLDKNLEAALFTFWQRPELELVHLVRFFIETGALRSDEKHDARFLGYGFWVESLFPAYRRTHPNIGLRELAAAFTAAGLDPRRIGRGLLGYYNELAAPLGLPPAHIWPYWSENLDLLENALGPASGEFMERYYQKGARRNAFQALRSLPKPPERLVPLLWNLALGPKSERPLAQRCLEGLPDKRERLITSLTASDAETRFAAAEWLGRIGDERAIAPLLAAFKKERNEATKGAIMSALEHLGVPVDQFLDRPGLLKEAQKGIGKGVPEDLKWFPLDQLPTVHWEDSGKPVESAIVQWWLVQGFKLKNPEPGALLRRYCASLKASEREALGQFVLEAWLAQDVAPLTRAAAEKEAMNRAHSALQAAQNWAQWAKQNPQMAQQMGSLLQVKTVQEYYDEILPEVLRQPTGSAISSKGILSVAGACVQAGAAPVVSRYLKEWYGQRAAQCRALLQMLAWVEHPTATQLLLAVGSRFRTKSIQEEANKQAQALAERKGWTVAELADRTIPSAGLDEDGVLTIDYGPRQFTARLNEKLEFLLRDPEGKDLKSLPDPRRDDDEAKAAEAKKGFAAAKKELKSVVTMQRDRFYEAMCTQRTWPFDDWSMYLNQHPIARHHCQRLVWAIIREDKVAQLFRPLPDGSLTDPADEPVTPGAGDSVRVAHECQVTPEQSQLWRQHLKDYEVEPLFEQFGRPNFSLDEGRQHDDSIGEFQGHLVEAFKLRGRATKLGYNRGETQDGGWFYEYRKRFPTLGIETMIEFSGNSLPEENRTVALTFLRFNRVAAEGELVIGGGKMTLSEVPAVLLSECWNDLRQLAAEGPGFDPEWEKKVQT